MHQYTTRFDYGWLTLNGLCEDVAEAWSKLKRYRRPSWSVAGEAFDLKSSPVANWKLMKQSENENKHRSAQEIRKTVDYSHFSAEDSLDQGFMYCTQLDRIGHIKNWWLKSKRHCEHFYSPIEYNKIHNPDVLHKDSVFCFCYFYILPPAIAVW